MPAPASWDWTIGNVNASALQTQTAYRALTEPSNVGHGPTRNFNVIVWNDIIDKIIEQREYWGDIEWSQIALSRSATKMIPGNRMTADRFNTAVLNMPPIHPWGWEATLGRKDIHPGDVCFGVYFLYLINGLNHWIEDLSPRYVKPANPFIMGMSISNHTLVRRALHIISNQRIVLRITTDAKIDHALHAKAAQVFHANIVLNLPLFNVQHVMLPLFYNLRLHNNTAVTTAVPIVFSNPISLDIAGRISFDTMAYIRCAVNGLSTFIGTLGIPNSVPVLIDNSAELINSGAVIVSIPGDFAGSLAGQFTGEAYVREPDSLLVKEDLDIQYSGAAAFSFSEILDILAGLEIDLTPAADVTVSAVHDIVAALNIESEHAAVIRDQTATRIRGGFLSEHSMETMVYRKRFSAHRAHLDAELIAAAKAGFAPDELYTGADLLMQSETAAVFDFANHYLSTGTNLTMQFLMAAAAELQNNKLPMSGSMTGTFDMTIKAGVNPNPMGFGASFTDSIVGPEADITVVPGSSVVPTSVEMEYTVSIAAVISTSDNRLYAAGGINSTYTGSATVHLLGAVELGANIDSEHTGAIEFSMRGSVPVIANKVFSLTDSVTITTQRFILASEIDDELVSDLDDTLVHNVEFRYNT